MKIGQNFRSLTLRLPYQLLLESSGFNSGRLRQGLLLAQVNDSPEELLLIRGNLKTVGWFITSRSPARFEDRPSQLLSTPAAQELLPSVRS